MTAATTLRPPVAVYREEQNFSWWVYVLLALMAAVGAGFLAWHGRPPDPRPVGAGWSGQVPLAVAIGLVVPSVLVVGVLRMTTLVMPTECRVWFGWVPTYQHAVPLAAIRRIEVVRYRPIAECGGWGIRRGPEGERVLNARGDQGVRLWLEDGSRLLIGSQRPEELARALEQARRTAT